MPLSGPKPKSFTRSGPHLAPSSWPVLLPEFADPSLVGKFLNIAGSVSVGIAVVEGDEQIGPADEEEQQRKQLYHHTFP